MKRILVLLLISVFFADLNAQISHGGQPKSFTQTHLKSNIDYRIMPEVDVEQLLMEDALDEQIPDIPWRFGKDMEVDFNLNNSGTWDVLENGDRIWRLEITSYGAYSINLIYSEFEMPPGGSLFLYNPQKTHIIGSFTSENHKPDGSFATVPVKGETSILEYYEPAAYVGQGKLAISYVIHAYKDFYKEFEKGFGDSGDCNVNVNCPEGDEWQDQKRGVAMILLSNNSRKCTGSLINNTAIDGTPYFLTAAHCGGQESTWIIMFNYESPGCNDVDGPLNQSVQFATRKAYNTVSDVLLIELSEEPPLEYNVFYNGWNRLNAATSNITTIHHPKGDIKKISFDYDTIVSDKYLGTSGILDSHWKIEQWDLGTTEGGSSGSPLFNSDKQIIGQLHGGYASCSNLASDWYGKFSMSWDYYSEPDKSLQSWLDPLESGVMSIPGYDPSISQYDNNAQLSSIMEPVNQYEGFSTIKPKLLIQNKGTQNLQSLNVSYQINEEEAVQLNWTGDLPQADTAHVIFPEIGLNYGDYQFKAYVDSPNNQEDEYLFNDTLSKSFEVLRTHDIAITNLLSPQGVNCTADSSKVVFIVQNTGVVDLEGIIANLYVDEVLFGSYEFDDPITVGTSKSYVLSVLEQDSDWHDLLVQVEILGETDQNPENNELQTTYNTYGNRIFLQLETDDNAAEISWTITDQQGEIVAFGDDFENNQEYKFNFCLAADCYFLNVYDEGGDGIQSANGFNLLNVTEDTLYANNPDFLDSISVPFCFADGITSEFIIAKDTNCLNQDVQFTNLSLNADSYEWVFEGGNPEMSTDKDPIVQYTSAGTYDVSLKAISGDQIVENIKEDFVIVVNCSGIDEVQSKYFSIYPNPNSGSFEIKLNTLNIFNELNIYNSLGQMIYSRTLQDENHYRIHLKEEKGIYIVELKSEKEISRSTLIIR